MKDAMTKQIQYFICKLLSAIGNWNHLTFHACSTDDSWLTGSSVMFAPRETFAFGSRRSEDDDTWSNISSNGKRIDAFM